jgi:PhzF family phenazine biosynthesis protein
MPTHLTQVDAFTDRPFGGNPAAVCVLEEFPRDDWMQAVAAEMNLSETAFVVARGPRFDLRWFTPTVEVDLCGHATLAVAWHLWESGATRAERLLFETRSGPLEARRAAEGVAIELPSRPVAEAAPPPGMLEALGLGPEQALTVAAGEEDWLVEVESVAALDGLAPDMARLARIRARGVIVTARGEGDPFHFCSRFFAPAVGVPEDPVTGSAHASLGAYWAPRLGLARLCAEQRSRRRGRLWVEPAGERVVISGGAVTVGSFELRMDPVHD